MSVKHLGALALLTFYRALMTLLGPWLVLFMIVRAKRLGKPIVGLSALKQWQQRLGFALPPVTAVDRVWVHAVSLGEVNSISVFVKQMCDQGLSVVVTSQTNTGFWRAKELFAAQAEVGLFVIDQPGALKRFVRHYSICDVVVVESEIWPTMLTCLPALGVRVSFANARISKSTFEGFLRVEPLAQKLFGSLSLVCAQDPESARRFIELGAAPLAVKQHANLKFLHAATTSAKSASKLLHSLVAASTHAGEEEAALALHELHRAESDRALLVLVPRHPERFHEVKKLLDAQGVNYALRSRGDPLPSSGVYLADTLGELNQWYALCQMAFVGGSLVDVGGHNPLEAAAEGAVVLMGPYTHKCEQSVAALKAYDAMIQVSNQEELAETFRKLLHNPARLQQMQDGGRLAVMALHAEAKRQLEALLEQVKMPRKLP